MMRIFLAGHNGMVGQAIARRLAQDTRYEVMTLPRAALDLSDQRAVGAHLGSMRPDVVIIAAAKVGGILANSRQPAAFIHDNLAITTNLIHAAHQADVQQIIQLGSSCIYPRDAAQPIKESALMTGPLEPTNAPYAIAKIAAIKMCESYNVQYGRDYRSLMPTNLYGPGDNFHPENSHVIPALLRRFHKAASQRQRHVTLWGSGTPRREFLHVDDLADAVAFTLATPKAQIAALTEPFQSHLNVGTGRDRRIIDIARKIATLTGFRGAILTDTSKPDGTPVKCLDTSAMSALGWQPRITLDDGLRATYAWYRAALTSGQKLRAS